MVRWLWWVLILIFNGQLQAQPPCGPFRSPDPSRSTLMYNPNPDTSKVPLIPPSGARPRESYFFRKGQSLPQLRARSLDGELIRFSDFAGKIIVLNFWFTGCRPCIREIPELNQLADSFPKGRVVFLAVALDDSVTLKKFLRSNPFHYTIIRDGLVLVKRLNVQLFPTHVVIDQEGKVYFHSSGGSKDLVPWLRYSIRELLLRSPIPFRT